MRNSFWNLTARLGLIMLLACTGTSCAIETSRDQQEAAGTSHPTERLRNDLLHERDLPGEWRQVATAAPAVDGEAGEVVPESCAQAGERLKAARTKWSGPGVEQASVSYASDTTHLKEEVVSVPGVDAAELMDALGDMVDACRHFAVTGPGEQTLSGEMSPADFGQGESGFGWSSRSAINSWLTSTSSMTTPSQF
ncbi:MAG: hypothetical protein M3306_13215 [Actinomycetota bacterium]|nr:hypothetical protein [Actinomycetota bacterium]